MGSTMGGLREFAAFAPQVNGYHRSVIVHLGGKSIF
jgi:hypothetical protein